MGQDQNADKTSFQILHFAGRILLRNAVKWKIRHEKENPVKRGKGKAMGNE